MTNDIKNILRELKKGLAEIYGDQLEAVYLYGSYARGGTFLFGSKIITVEWG